MTQQYPLHQNRGDSLRETKEHMTKQQRAVWTVLVVCSGLLCLLWIAFLVFLFMVDKTVAFMLAVLLVGLMFLFMLMWKMTQKTSCLQLSDKIIFTFWEMGRTPYRHTYRYADVAYLYQGDCPRCFIPAKGKFFYSRIWWTDEEWRERNGIYIVGCNSVNDPLFACIYSEQAWEILSERCKDTARCMTEEEYGKFMEERERLEKETEKQNRKEEYLNAMDGYIN